MIKIVPSFQAIFDDFELDLPRITIHLINICIFIANYWYLIAFGVLLFMFVLGARRLRDFFRRTLSPRFVPPLASLHSAELMDMLGIVIKHGRPLAGALSTLARYHFDPLVRRKLLFVRNEVEQGADPWESLATTKLITGKEAKAITSATSPNTRAWSLHHLAQLRYDHVNGKFLALRGALEIVPIIVMGAVVMFVAVALLLPLFHLVECLV